MCITTAKLNISSIASSPFWCLFDTSYFLYKMFCFWSLVNETTVFLFQTYLKEDGILCSIPTHYICLLIILSERCIIYVYILQMSLEQVLNCMGPLILGFKKNTIVLHRSAVGWIQVCEPSGYGGTVDVLLTRSYTQVFLLCIGWAPLTPVLFKGLTLISLGSTISSVYICG